MDISISQQIIGFFRSPNLILWVTAVATSVLAILTIIYVRLTKKILDNQSNPCVIITVVHDKDRPTLLQLVVRNIGTSIAYDVRFEFSRKLPARAWGLQKPRDDQPTEMNDGPLIEGIPALGPGESRRIDWGQYGGLHAFIGDSPILATCRFKKNFTKEMPPQSCPLEVASFKGTVAAETPVVNIAKNLEKIATMIGYLATGYKKLQVQIDSFPDKSNDIGT